MNPASPATTLSSNVEETSVTGWCSSRPLEPPSNRPAQCARQGYALCDPYTRVTIPRQSYWRGFTPRRRSGRSKLFSGDTLVLEVGVESCPGVEPLQVIDFIRRTMRSFRRELVSLVQNWDKTAPANLKFYKNHGLLGEAQIDSWVHNEAATSRSRKRRHQARLRKRSQHCFNEAATNRSRKQLPGAQSSCTVSSGLQ